MTVEKWKSIKVSEKNQIKLKKLRYKKELANIDQAITYLFDKASEKDPIVSQVVEKVERKADLRLASDGGLTEKQITEELEKFLKK